MKQHPSLQSYMTGFKPHTIVQKVQETTPKFMYRYIRNARNVHCMHFTWSSPIHVETIQSIRRGRLDFPIFLILTGPRLIRIELDTCTCTKINAGVLCMKYMCVYACVLYQQTPTISPFLCNTILLLRRMK